MSEEEESQQNTSSKKRFGWQEAAGAFFAIAIIVILIVFFKTPGNQPADIRDTVQPPEEEEPPVAPDAGISIQVRADDHMIGDPQAPLTLVVFTDLECPFCARFHATLTELMKNNRGKIKLIMRHFPLSFHQHARTAAEAAECAAEQDMFWGFVEAAFAGGDLTPAALEEYAEEIGMDMDEFESCLSENKYANNVDRNIAEGAQAGVQGTPSSILIDAAGKTQGVSGALPLADMQSLINTALTQ